METRAEDIRPRRSVLYIPGANARAIEKARTLAADVVILDLEDAVAPQAKADARRHVAEILRNAPLPCECVVRVNGLATPWGQDDLTAMAQIGAGAILLPKVEDGDMLAQASALLRQAGGPHDQALWAMIETPKAFLRLDAIAGSHDRLQCLVVGTSDLVKDLHARHTPQRTETLLARSMAVMAARAHGLSVVDGVHLDIHDIEGLAQTCRQARDMGFDGKTLIHPGQIASANAAFGPDEDAITLARRYIAAWDAGRQNGVVVVDGMLVEHLHIVEARRLLALADRIGALQARASR